MAKRFNQSLHPRNTSNHPRVRSGWSRGSAARDRWQLGLERYETLFRNTEITLAVLPKLTEQDLKELGLPLGPRKLVLKSLAELSRDNAAANVDQTVNERREVANDSAERCQMTVMFVDLVASTALFARLDPEYMR